MKLYFVEFFYVIFFLRHLLCSGIDIAKELFTRWKVMKTIFQMAPSYVGVGAWLSFFTFTLALDFHLVFIFIYLRMIGNASHFHPLAIIDRFVSCFLHSILISFCIQHFDAGHFYLTEKERKKMENSVNYLCIQ